MLLRQDLQGTQLDINVDDRRQSDDDSLLDQETTLKS